MESTFISQAEALLEALKHDPGIISIGEMRAENVDKISFPKTTTGVVIRCSSVRPFATEKS